MRKPDYARRALNEVAGLVSDFDELPAESIRRVLSHITTLLVAHLAQWPADYEHSEDFICTIIENHGTAAFTAQYRQFVHQCALEAAESAIRSGPKAQTEFLLNVGVTPHALLKAIRSILGLSERDPATLSDESIEISDDAISREREY